MARIRIENLRKEFGSNDEPIVAVEDVSLTVPDGEFLVLVGPSGCGKTTTLRCIAGLEDVSGGSIHFGDTDVTEFRARNRDVAMVFQNYALYPHMDVESNIGFGLKLSTELSTAEIDERVERAVELLDIPSLLGDKPKELSGGQQQRVALGRAIVREPDLFLMDEPLSNLDAKLRSEMRTELQELQHDLDVTTVYVTHDQTEAMAMGDRIAVMNDGQLQQVGPPEDVYRDPANEFVADFIGSPSINLFDGTVESDRLLGPREFAYELADSAPVAGHDRVRIGVRPEDLRVVPRDEGVAEATVNVVEPMGSENFLYLSFADHEITARVDSDVRPAADETVGLDFPETALYLFDADTGEALKTKTDDVGVDVDRERRSSGGETRPTKSD